MVSGRWGREREVELYPDSSSHIVEIVLTQLKRIETCVGHIESCTPISDERKD